MISHIFCDEPSFKSAYHSTTRSSTCSTRDDTTIDSRKVGVQTSISVGGKRESNAKIIRSRWDRWETDERHSRIRDSFCRTDSSHIVSFDSSVIADVWRLGVGICIRLITTRCHLIFYAQSIRNKSYVIRDTATLNDSISLVRVPLSSGFSNKKWRWMCGCVCVF